MEYLKLFEEYRIFKANKDYWNKKDPNEPFFNYKKGEYKKKKSDKQIERLLEPVGVSLEAFKTSSQILNKAGLSLGYPKQLFDWGDPLPVIGDAEEEDERIYKPEYEMEVRDYDYFTDLEGNHIYSIHFDINNNNISIKKMNYDKVEWSKNVKDFRYAIREIMNDAGDDYLDPYNGLFSEEDTPEMMKLSKKLSRPGSF